jgi:aryl-alcohol dehydrogenase-like predicted oxidoreductase
VRYVDVCGERLSVVGLGTWQFGSRSWGYGPDYEAHEALDVANRALDLGINLLDTAELYGFGRSERVLARVLAERREEVFLATKLYPLLPIPTVERARAEASLRRLATDLIDLYQIHWSNRAVPLGKQMEGMRDLLDAGVVRHVGVSNFSLERWREAERLLGAPVLSNQIHLNLVHRAALEDLVPWAAANDRLVIAYSPLAQGLLSARYAPGYRPHGFRAGNTAFLAANLERAEGLYAALRRVAARHEATPAQVALAWVIRNPNVVVIPGASTVAQIESNAAAADLDLGDDDVAELFDAAGSYRPVGGLRAIPPAISALAVDEARTLQSKLQGMRSR